jgi:hypothetical protein
VRVEGGAVPRPQAAVEPPGSPLTIPVAANHAECALGHTIGGVPGVYDRHDYCEEKRAAFEALAAKIDHILRTWRW